MAINLAQYRRPSGNGELRPAESDRLPRHRAGESFLKGPIPTEWLCCAARLPGKALHVALALWFLGGMAKRRTVKLTRSALNQFGVGRRNTAYAGLRRLEAAGLVKVKSKQGACSTVTIREVPK